MEIGNQAKYISPEEALALLNTAGIHIGRNTFYKCLASGEISSIRVGRKYFIHAKVVELLEERTQRRKDSAEA